MTKGCFIMIDGIDGSGKKTQLDLLVSRLKNSGFTVHTNHFPQYGTKSAGLVEEYLNGAYGTAEEVSPEQASIFYAVDRYAASFKIRKWLQEGKIVITNRYVASNMGHQGGKIADPVKREDFFRWNDQLEFGIFNIPKPDINIILHVTPEIAQELVDKKTARSYIQGAKRDIHEDNLSHLRNAEQTYLLITRLFPEYTLIECVEGGNLLSVEEIQKKVWQFVERRLNNLEIVTT